MKIKFQEIIELNNLPRIEHNYSITNLYPGHTQKMICDLQTPLPLELFESFPKKDLIKKGLTGHDKQATETKYHSE